MKWVMICVLQVYESAQIAMVRPTPTDLIDLQVGYTEGDRSGHLHVGYNQKLFIGATSFINLSFHFIYNPRSPQLNSL